MYWFSTVKYSQLGIQRKMKQSLHKNFEELYNEADM